MLYTLNLLQLIPEVSYQNQPLLVIQNSDAYFEAFGRIIRKSSISNPIYRCIDGDDALNFLYHTGNYVEVVIAPHPLMILVNLNLPVTDGTEVLKQIKYDENLRTIPVVVFTTSSNPKNVDNCYRYGVNRYILKPIDIQKLIKTIQVFVDYWFETVILPEPAIK